MNPLLTGLLPGADTCREGRKTPGKPPLGQDLTHSQLEGRPSRWREIVGNVSGSLPQVPGTEETLPNSWAIGVSFVLMK